MHPTHRYNKIRKAMLKALLDQRSDCAIPYSNKPFLVQFQGDVDLDDLAEAVIKALEEAEKAKDH